jgi:hypothetical protein
VTVDIVMKILPLIRKASVVVAMVGTLGSLALGSASARTIVAPPSVWPSSPRYPGDEPIRRGHWEAVKAEVCVDAEVPVRDQNGNIVGTAPTRVCRSQTRFVFIPD